MRALGLLGLAEWGVIRAVNRLGLSNSENDEISKNYIFQSIFMIYDKNETIHIYIFLHAKISVLFIANTLMQHLTSRKVDSAQPSSTSKLADSNSIQ